MNKIALTLSALALLAGGPAIAGDAAAGKEKSATCAACHGANGVSAAALYPHLAGQYENYLLHALRGYKSGQRQNAIMQPMVAALSDADLADLAAYFASQDGPLKDGTVQP